MKNRISVKIILIIISVLSAVLFTACGAEKPAIDPEPEEDDGGLPFVGTWREFIEESDVVTCSFSKDGKYRATEDSDEGAGLFLSEGEWTLSETEDGDKLLNMRLSYEDGSEAEFFLVWTDELELTSEQSASNRLYDRFENKYEGKGSDDPEGQQSFLGLINVTDGILQFHYGYGSGELLISDKKIDRTAGVPAAGNWFRCNGDWFAFNEDGSGEAHVDGRTAEIEWINNGGERKLVIYNEDGSQYEAEDGAYVLTGNVMTSEVGGVWVKR